MNMQSTKGLHARVGARRRADCRVAQNLARCCLNYIGVELENPFGRDANDLPLKHFQAQGAQSSKVRIPVPGKDCQELIVALPIFGFKDPANGLKTTCRDQQLQLLRCHMLMRAFSKQPTSQARPADTEMTHCKPARFLL